MLMPAAGALAGPLEETEQLTVHPSDPSRMVLRYINGGEGLVFSEDGGESWGALCARATKPESLERAPSKMGDLAISNDGTLFMGTFTAMLVNEGADGCGWAEDPLFSGAWITDISHHPTDPDVLFAVTSTAPDGMNGVYRREGSGPWEAIGVKDEIDINELFVVQLPGGGLRLYVRAIRGTIGEPPDLKPNYVLRHSDDMGDTWTEYAFGETDGKVSLEGVDPTSADRIVVAIARERPEVGGAMAKDPDSLMVSSDRGQSFAEYLTMTTFGGAAFASDGQLWVGDRGDSFDPEAAAGLFHSTSLDAEATKVNDQIQVRCIEPLADDELFICQPWEAGRIKLDGTGYERMFAYDEVDRYVACDELDLVEECRQPMLSAWCGVSHFPEAKMCCPYPDRVSMDSNLVPGEEVPTIVLDCPDPAPPDAGMMDPTTPDPTPSDPEPMMPTDTGAAGDDGGEDGDDDGSGGGDGGCSVGPVHTGHASGSALAALALLTLARRRRS
ncbi:MAG: hypothetical protein OXT09_07095 [Myxococcales bacterium]|nr:hypothetical protein [Myxococcales bacterium]